MRKNGKNYNYITNENVVNSVKLNLSSEGFGRAGIALPHTLQTFARRRIHIMAVSLFNIIYNSVWYY